MSFRTFNRVNRCPLCNADHSCAVTVDGLHHCHHHQGDEVSGWVFLGVSKIGFGMYRREDDPRLDRDEPLFRIHRDAPPRDIPRTVQVSSPPAGASASATASTTDPAESLAFWLEHGGRGMVPLTSDSPQAKSWAMELGLPDESVFEQIDTRWLENDGTNRGDLLCFPERNGEGEIIGYSRRYRGGLKRSVGKRGIIVPRALTPTSYIHDASSMGEDVPICGPIHIVEGASDVLAMLTMRRNVIGRPSATGGGDHLVAFLRKMPREWLDIIVVGENDRKSNGAWPGRAGAYRVAKYLSDELCLCTYVVPAPPSVKDMRDYVISDVRDYLLAELNVAKSKYWVRDRASYAAAGLDDFFFCTQTRQEPGDPLRFQDPLSPAAVASILTLAAVAAGNARLPNLDDLSGDRIGAAVERGRQRDGYDSYREEEQAKAAVAAARRNHDRFPCCHPRYLGFLRMSNGQPWIGEVRCEKRCCPGCRQWLDHRELENARLRFQRAVKSGESLFRIECSDPDCWHALHAAIRRAEGDFLRLTREDGSFLVFTTYAPSLRSSWHAKAAVVSPADAIAELRTALGLCGCDRRSVSTSHAWKLLRPDKPTGKSEFIGEVDRQAVSQINEIADTVGAIAVPRMPRSADSSMRRCWDFLRPGGWTPEERDHLFACWSSGEILPFRPPSEHQEDPSFSADEFFPTPFDSSGLSSVFSTV